MTFEEYQTSAIRVPVSLRNNLDRVNLPLRGLQEEAGKISSLLQKAMAAGPIEISAEQSRELQDRLADLLWCTTLLAHETGTSLAEVAGHSLAQIQERVGGLDPDHR